MFRFGFSMLLLSLVLSAAACGDSAQPEASLVPQALAAPANAPVKGWQSSVSPTAVDDTARDYE